MTLLSISALIALIPAAILPFRGSGRRDALFWLLLGVALAGPLVWLLLAFGTGWRTGLAPALWLTVATVLVFFGLIALVSREGFRLSALLFPYLILLGLIATAALDRSGQPMVGGAAPAGWVYLHIVVSLETYAVLTLAAIAGVSTFLQDRALKNKKATTLTRVLPTLSAGESLELKLLGLTAGILGIGLLTGMVVQYLDTGVFLVMSHKTLLSFATFAIVIILLWVRWRTGLRGRKAARVVLFAYLLLTLAYPGVKFVSDVLIG
ncbi:MAG: cytochrome c biogenesis protein CcsA [Proteobacteria bacterium]|nr:cytochrome c biogenesis protein CcsA [Pseudomonadota bacterium]